jgi:hypothetical protein
MNSDNENESAAEPFGIGLTLATAGHQQSFSRLSAVGLFITIKNGSENDLYFSQSLPQTDFRLHLIGPSGQTCRETAKGEEWKFMQPSSYKGVRLGPNQELTYPIQLDAFYDMRELGEYKISVGRNVRIIGREQDLIISNTLRFEINEY